MPTWLPPFWIPPILFVLIEIRFYLAQSQLIASRFIHGDEKTPYGPRFKSLKKTGESPVIDPVEQVCSQVILHKESMQNQLQLIGAKRFIIVPYEDFLC